MFGLAQAFKMGGDYAPGIGAFESMPEYYTNLWKEWWKKRGVTTPDAQYRFYTLVIEHPAIPSCETLADSGRDRPDVG